VESVVAADATFCEATTGSTIALSASTVRTPSTGCVPKSSERTGVGLFAGTAMPPPSKVGAIDGCIGCSGDATDVLVKQPHTIE